MIWSVYMTYKSAYMDTEVWFNIKKNKLQKMIFFWYLHIVLVQTGFYHTCVLSVISLCVHAKLTHWGWVTHICVGNLTIIGSDNSLSPDRRQPIIRTIAEILLIRPLGTNFSEMSIEIQTLSIKEMHLKMSSGQCRSLCLGLNVLCGSLQV